MAEGNVVMDLSDDDEDKVVRTIQLQKSLISESQSLINTQVEEINCDPLQNAENENNLNNEIGNTCAAEDEETSYRSALAANLEYDDYLARLETNLKTLISDCKSKLSELSNIRENKKQERNLSYPFGKCNYVYIFGTPYFKDKDYYPCPPNADARKKMQNDELCWADLPSIHWWTPTQTKLLIDGIKELSAKACKVDAQTEKNAMVRRLNALDENDQEERTKLEEQIENFSIDEFVTNHLNEKIATMDHDWLKLSASVLNGRHSPEECRGFWYNYLHPKFHKGNWTEEEKVKLRRLAEENNRQNWDLIAEQLGTKRSGYQCFAQHQSEDVEQAKQRWTDVEDEQLKCLVEKFRVGDYVPWGQVTMHMRGRTKTQLYNRWTYSLNPQIRKGRFTIQEDIIILRGIQKWGENFQKIAMYMPDRVAPQIRIRYHSGISKLNFNPWTIEDDNRLLQLVQEHGHNWIRISKYFTGKSNQQVRHRHDTLTKWMEANPGKPLKEISSRRNNRANIYHCHPEMWTFADKLLSGGNPKSVSTSLLQSKPQLGTVKQHRNKRRSLIDEQLAEYFRGTYSKPSVKCRKFTSLPECGPKLISDVASFLQLLEAKLNIPCDEDLDADASLEPEDRQVLKGLRDANQEVFEETPSHDWEHINFSNTSHTASSTNIDYVQPSDTHSTELILPHTFVEPYAVPWAFHNPAPAASTLKPPAHPLFGDLKYLCPPNFSTLVGLRSILLGKRKLVESIAEFATDPILSEIDDASNVSFQQASKLWNDRLMCLFALPNFLSKMAAPGGSTNQQIVPGTSGLPPLHGVNSDSDSAEVGPRPGSSSGDVFDIGPTMVSEDGTVRVIAKRKTGKKKGGPLKKRVRK